MLKEVNFQKVKRIFRRVWKMRNYWLRGLICWAVGTLVYLNISTENFDTRFKVRGNHLSHDKIVIIEMSEQEWTLLRGQTQTDLRQLKELGPLTDAYFWDTNTWVHILRKVLSLSPSRVGITLMFGSEIGISDSITSSEFNLLRNEKVFWAARTNDEDTPILPRFSREYGGNVGMLELTRDGDGVLRRFGLNQNTIPNLAERLAGRSTGFASDAVDGSLIINYQGPPGSFKTISIYELLREPEDSKLLMDKIVIFGTRGIDAHTYQTPFGQMSRAEIVANLTDNLMFDRKIRPVDFSLYSVLLASIVFTSAILVFVFQQMTSLFFHIFGLVFWLTLSTWLFDSQNLFWPSLPVTVSMSISYVVFLSFQSVLNEKRAWKLEREKRYITEMEKMKQNFVSLISHDLKTPIAKIQGTIDKLRSGKEAESIAKDLGNLDVSTKDLNRNIQSILHVSRIEAADHRLHLSPVDLNDIIQSVVKDLESLASQKNLEFEVSLEPLFSCEVDRNLIQEVISNIIENSVKYSKPGTVIEIKSFEEENDIYFQVIDAGEGLSEDDINRIWEKFYRAHKHRDGQIKGTGLGLYLVRYFVELHGGKVFAHQDQSHRFVIGFKLPTETN